MSGSRGGRWRLPWREDHLGERDLTRWPTAAGRMLLRASARLAGWARRRLPEGDLPWLVLG